ncbi:hypothetical protein C8F01DRAFT_920307, partial [Mycena amicta]
DSHRGRAKVIALQSAEREKILAESKKGPKQFYDAYGDLKKPRRVQTQVPLEEMSDGFMKRLNYPLRMPEAFDHALLNLNTQRAKVLELEPPDTTPLRSFSRPISEEEIEDLKRHIKEHGI